MQTKIVLVLSNKTQDPEKILKKSKTTIIDNISVTCYIYFFHEFNE